MADLLPRLQRFYHAAAPQVWLTVPLPLLVAHTAMMARIEAGEALQAAARAAIPFMSEGDRRSQLHSWETLTGGRRIVRPRTPEERRAMAAVHGIGSRRVKVNR